MGNVTQSWPWMLTVKADFFIQGDSSRLGSKTRNTWHLIFHRRRSLTWLFARLPHTGSPLALLTSLLQAHFALLYQESQRLSGFLLGPPPLLSMGDLSFLVCPTCFNSIFPPEECVSPSCLMKPIIDALIQAEW